VVDFELFNKGKYTVSDDEEGETSDDGVLAGNKKKRIELQNKISLSFSPQSFNLKTLTLRPRELKFQAHFPINNLLQIEVTKHPMPRIGFALHLTSYVRGRQDSALLGMSYSLELVIFFRAIDCY
jgi:hypothetical protein